MNEFEIISKSGEIIDLVNKLDSANIIPIDSDWVYYIVDYYGIGRAIRICDGNEGTGENCIDIWYEKNEVVYYYKLTPISKIRKIRNKIQYKFIPRNVYTFYDQYSRHLYTKVGSNTKRFTTYPLANIKQNIVKALEEAS